MKTSSPNLNLFCILNILVIWSAHGINILFYKDVHFSALVLESHTPGDCINISSEIRDAIVAIRTDTCFIGYGDRNCEPRGSEKYMPGDILLSNYVTVDYLGSFQTCNEKEGGKQLNVDVTKYYTWGPPPDVLKSFQNLCSCFNVPKEVQDMEKWSVNNHHNDLLAYYEPDCSTTKWNPRVIAAGHNWDSRFVSEHKKTDTLTNSSYKIQSFGPDKNSLYFQASCVSVKAPSENKRLVTSESPENLKIMMKSIETDDQGSESNEPVETRTPENEQPSPQIVEPNPLIEEPRSPVDKPKEDQCKCPNDLESISAKLDKLDQQIQQIQQQFQNFTIQIGEMLIPTTTPSPQPTTTTSLAKPTAAQNPRSITTHSTQPPTTHKTQPPTTLSPIPLTTISPQPLTTISPQPNSTNSLPTSTASSSQQPSTTDSLQSPTPTKKTKRRSL